MEGLLQRLLLTTDISWKYYQRQKVSLIDAKNFESMAFCQSFPCPTANSLMVGVLVLQATQGERDTNQIYKKWDIEWKTWP